MGDLTRNISRHEIACKCGCGFDTIDFEVVKIVQMVASHFAYLRGVPKVVVAIHSGARCPAHNKSVGGGQNSQHLHARAIDFSIEGVDPAVVYDFLDREFPNSLGLGKYAGFTHVDTRSGRARW